MDVDLVSLGYKLEPTRYKPPLGYSRLKAAISGEPTQRFFDVKLLRLPTFDGGFSRQTQISRHEQNPKKTYQVCLGWLSMESHQGEAIQFFSFGGVLQTSVLDEYRTCEFASNAPIFKQQEAPGAAGSVLIDEIVELLAEIEAKLPRHEDELYSHLARYEPYEVFLSCLSTLQKRINGVPTNLRREKFRMANADLEKINRIIRSTDGWDGCSPTLDELVSPKA